MKLSSVLISFSCLAVTTNSSAFLVPHYDALQHGHTYGHRGHLNTFQTASALSTTSTKSLSIWNNHVPHLTSTSSSTLLLSSTSSSSTSTSSSSTTSTSNKQPNSLHLHHVAIRTRDIETAIKFYSLFGYQIEHKFRSGPARACWLINDYFTQPRNRNDNNNNDNTDNDNNDNDDDGNNNKKITCIKGRNDAASRLELIEVPPYMLNEAENTIKKAIDLIQKESLLGLNHYAIDVTYYIQYLKEESDVLSSSSSSSSSSSYYGLDQFLEYIQGQSVQLFNKTLRVAVQPRQQVIGTQVYELAFLYDADGAIIELVRYIKEVDLKPGQVMDSGWEPWDGKGFVGKED